MNDQRAIIVLASMQTNMPVNDHKHIALLHGINAIKQNTWTPLIDALPTCKFESEADHDKDGNAQWFGMVSDTLEITDGYQYARGHYRIDGDNNGSWVIYGAEHDFQDIDVDAITHYKLLPELPCMHKHKQYLQAKEAKQA